MTSSGRINCRTLLWYLVFTGFVIHYCLRVDVSMAIVAMVMTRSSVVGHISSECLTHPNFPNSSSQKNATIATQDGFDWDESQQGMVLGALFWGLWCTQVPGGWLAQLYGGKAVFGLSQLLASSLSFLLPTAAYTNIYLFIFLRAIQGMALGACAPAVQGMVGKWIPPNERSGFITCYLGCSLGVAGMYLVCGLLISSFGWESVFYLSGTTGLLWFALWWYFVYDSPSQHPHISEVELKFIHDSLGDSSQNRQLATPWKAMLLSKAVWLNAVGQFGCIWPYYTVVSQLPTYFKWIHGWDIKATGILSCLPHLSRLVVGLIYSKYSDYLLRTNKMSRNNVRKLATAVGSILQGLFVLALAFVGCNRLAALALVIASVSAFSGMSSGPLPSAVDIAPNFAGVTSGLAGTIGVLSGFISPAIVGSLTLNNQTTGQWQLVWLIAAGVAIGFGIIYIIFADSSVQPWNFPEPKTQPENTVLLTPDQKILIK